MTLNEMNTIEKALRDNLVGKPVAAQTWKETGKKFLLRINIT